MSDHTKNIFLMNRHYFNQDLTGLERYFQRETVDPDLSMENRVQPYTPPSKPNAATGKHKTVAAVGEPNTVAAVGEPNTVAAVGEPNTGKPTPSEEQLSIVREVVQGNNVIVDSVFGSGKTTTILQICGAVKQVPILVLTYNARLKIETRNKCQKLGLRHVETHSYHALTVKYYSSRGNTDTEIKRVISQNLPLRKRHGSPPEQKIGLIILDEQQDMTPLYHHLVKKFIRDQKLANIQIVVLGDTFQNIYSYKGADARFLQLADQLSSGLTDRPWVRRQITVSYRATHPVSNFINKYLLGYQRVKTVRSGSPVRYLLCDAFSSYPFQEIMSYLKLGYQADDIYILAPSLRAGKEKSPVRRLENSLVEAGIPCFVPVDDNDELGDDVTRGKIVFSTFHQIKGSERPVVLVFNLDKSYYNFYARDVSPVECPNAVYVALSRSLSQMTVIHHYENEFFPMIDRQKLANDPKVTFLPLKRLVLKNKQTENHTLDCSVTELIRHLDMETIEKLNGMYRVVQLKKPGPPLNLPLTVGNTQKGAENVSDLNGIAIPMRFELKQRTGCCSVLEHLVKNSEKFPEKHQTQILSIRRRLRENEKVKTGLGLEISDLLYLANLYNSFESGYNSKREQIKHYDWISQDTFRTAEKRLGKYLNENADYEREINSVMLGRNIIGRVDVIQDKTLLELKCTRQLEPVHYVQVAVYGWLYQQKYGEDIELRVFNILTEEMVKLEITDSLNEIVSYLVTKKYGSSQETLDDQAFLNRVLNPNSLKN